MHKETLFLRELGIIEARIRHRHKRANSSRHSVEVACLIHELRTIDTIISKFQHIFGGVSGRTFTLNQIMRAICAHFEVSQTQILSKRPKQSSNHPSDNQKHKQSAYTKHKQSTYTQRIMRIKKIAAYCMYNYTASTSKEIGTFMGYRDHSCIAQYKAEIATEMYADAPLTLTINKIVERANDIKDIDQKPKYSPNIEYQPIETASNHQ